MPFNNSTKRFDRVWAFIDQFIAGEHADRSDFDVAFEDVRTSVNAAIAYLEGLAPIDQRYLGRKASAPTLRNDGAALQDGDLYISTAGASPNVVFVHNGSGWLRASDYPAPSAFFLTLVALADAAAMRGALGLGTSATFASTAFATALQGALADGAIPAATVTVLTDYHGVDTTKTAQYSATSAITNRPADEACIVTYFFRDDSTGYIKAVSASSGRTFIKRRSSSAWGSWVELPRTTDVVQRVTGGYAGTADALGDLAAGNYVHLLGAAATGFWSGASTNDHVITLTTGAGAAAQQIGFDKDGGLFYRGRSGATWNTDGWKEIITEKNREPGVLITYESSGPPADFPTSYSALNLNIIKRNTLGITLVSNQITFPEAGTFYVEAIVTARNASGAGRSAAIRLYNATAVAAEVLGTGFTNSNATVATCHLAGRFAVAANDKIELQGAASGASLANGDETDLNNPNIYSILKIWKVA